MTSVGLFLVTEYLKLLLANLKVDVIMMTFIKRSPLLYISRNS